MDNEREEISQVQRAHGGRRKRSPQIWAIRMAEIIYSRVRSGEPMPFPLPGLQGEDNGASIRFLQEVGFAKSWLDNMEAARKPGYIPYLWSVKRKLDEASSTYTYEVGMPTSGGRNRPAGKNALKYEDWLNQQERNMGEVSAPTPPVAQTKTPTVSDPIAEAIRSQYGDIL